MKLELSIEAKDVPEDILALLTRVGESCLATEGAGDMTVAGRIVDDEAIRAVNRAFRQNDMSTDVLSFPSVTYPPGKTARDCARLLRREGNFLGDCMISIEHAKSQAAEYGHSLSRELGYLFAHSMFHLMGYDHMTQKDKRVMRAMEERAMARVNLARERQSMREGQSMRDQELFERACAMLDLAYAPYSKFQVGACLLAEDGRAFGGCNIENASYGATICAERAAIAAAVSQGARRFTAIAVVGRDEAAWPCGICRQVLAEFSSDLRVICGDQASGRYTVEPLTALLPHAFLLKTEE